MIHEVRSWMLDLDLSNFDVITFDDGLATQYKHYKHFLKFAKPLYFFISTDIICDGEQDQNVIACAEAHEFSRRYDNRHYMTWEQIKEINKTQNCFIGGHSHTHPRLKQLGIRQQYTRAKKEVFEMRKEFLKQDIEIKSFCYPYNEEVIGYASELKRIGITEIFGKERIAIEELK